jgi:hypothetical protein
MTAQGRPTGSRSSGHPELHHGQGIRPAFRDCCNRGAIEGSGGAVDVPGTKPDISLFCKIVIFLPTFGIMRPNYRTLLFGSQATS